MKKNSIQTKQVTEINTNIKTHEQRKLFTEWLKQHQFLVLVVKFYFEIEKQFFEKEMWCRSPMNIWSTAKIYTMYSTICSIWILGYYNPPTIMIESKPSGIYTQYIYI